MTLYGLDEWLWAMFKPTPSLANFYIGQLFKWIVVTNDQIWLPIGLASDFEQCSHWLQVDLMTNVHVNWGQIMTKYDFLGARCVI